MLNIPEQPCGEYKIFLKDASGELLPAIATLSKRDWTDGSRHTECRIVLRWVGGEIDCIDGHFLASFKLVREQLALQNLYPMCYGASRKIIITGMAADMGLGMKVYQAEIGKMLQREQLVNIFAYGEDVEPVSVEVQEEFQRQWVQSIYKNTDRGEI